VLVLVLLLLCPDCCHSGTLLDQPRVQISGPKTDDPAAPPQLIDTFTAGLGGDHRDITGRSVIGGGGRPVRAIGQGRLTGECWL